MPDNDFNLIKQEVVEITSQVPKISSDDAFMVWFLRAFFTDDQPQAVNALTGSTNHKGTDAILIDDESRTAYVVQGKYHKQDKPPSESYSDLVAFTDLAGLLSGPIEPFKAMLNNAHSALQEQLTAASDKIVKANYRIGLLYVTTGQGHEEGPEGARRRSRQTGGSDSPNLRPGFAAEPLGRLP